MSPIIDLINHTGPGFYPILGVWLWHMVLVSRLWRWTGKGLPVPAALWHTLPMVAVLLGWLFSLHDFVLCFEAIAHCCGCYSRRSLMARGNYIALYPGMMGTLFGSVGLLWSVGGILLTRQPRAAIRPLAFATGIAGIGLLIHRYAEFFEAVADNETGLDLSLGTLGPGLLVVSVVLWVFSWPERPDSTRRPNPWRGAPSPLVAVLSSILAVISIPVLLFSFYADSLYALEGIADRLPDVAEGDQQVSDHLSVPTLQKIALWKASQVEYASFDTIAIPAEGRLSEYLPVAWLLAPDGDHSLHLGLATCPPRPTEPSWAAQIFPLHALRCREVVVNIGPGEADGWSIRADQTAQELVDLARKAGPKTEIRLLPPIAEGSEESGVTTTNSVKTDIESDPAPHLREAPHDHR